MDRPHRNPGYGVGNLCHAVTVVFSLRPSGERGAGRGGDLEPGCGRRVVRAPSILRSAEPPFWIYPLMPHSLVSAG